MNTTLTHPRPERLMTRLTPPAARPATRRRAAFWLLAFVFAATMLGTTLPTPLYDIYQAQWHFPAAIVTVIFAVYATGVLAALLLAGRSSDQAGRKPVLAVALGASVLSTVVFILAPDVGVLMAGRILSGLSAGLMTGTATAALTELVPASASRRASLVATTANMGGLGLGALIAGLFAQYAPHPTTLVFAVYLAVLAARYTANTSVVGCGAYWANSPAMSAPRPRPPMFAAVATSDARRPAEAGTSSVSAAVAVPVMSPADSPDTIRPARSTPTSGARMNTTVLSALAPRARASTGLRPAWSEDRPASSRAVSTPAAYTAKISVTMAAAKCHRAW